MTEERYMLLLKNADNFLKSSGSTKFTIDYLNESLKNTVLELQIKQASYELYIVEVLRILLNALVQFFKLKLKCILNFLGLKRFGCYKQ